ncbi:MAG: hypothetical protein LBC88_01715 [Spirochaetaceae bacterium]|nr:hypothetical protein [Spirochaetaceae bacterium]
MNTDTIITTTGMITNILTGIVMNMNILINMSMLMSTRTSMSTRMTMGAPAREAALAAG